MTTPRLSRLLLTLLILTGLLSSQLLRAQAEDSSSNSNDDISQSIHDSLKNRDQSENDALTAFRSGRQEQRLALLKTFGNRAISTRQDAVTKLGDKLTSSGKCQSLTTDQVTEIKNDFAVIAAKLNSTDSQLTTETDLDKAKTEVKSVFQDNRVFVVVVPATNGACLSERIITLIDGKLTTAVSKLKAAGLDTSAIETKMTTSKTDAQNALSIYLALLKNPGDPNAKTKFAQAKTDLQDARQLLGDIKSDIGNLTDQYEQKARSSADSSSTN